jgi:small subunit ribosomal protein S16
MLTIRLTRVGKKKDASFRVIVVESKRKVQAGNYLEMVGSYDPRSDRVELKADRIKHYLQNGATVSDTVHNLLVSNKIIDAKKKNVLPKKTVPKKEEPVAEAAAPVVVAAAADTKEEIAAEEPAAEVAADAPAEVVADAGSSDGGAGGADGGASA